MLLIKATIYLYIKYSMCTSMQYVKLLLKRLNIQRLYRKGLIGQTSGALRSLKHLLPDLVNHSVRRREGE